MALSARLDHLVYGVADLADGVRWFTEATGVEPTPGGRHVGFGTANYLVGLGPGRYLELVGPDPDAPASMARLPFGVGPDRPAGLRTWAIATRDIDASVSTARGRGYDPGIPLEMSRRTRNGDLLRWQLTADTVDASDGLVPFLIDWGASAHPSAALATSLELAAFTLRHPGPADIALRLRALGVEIADEELVGSPRAEIRVVLSTPRGEVLLPSADGARTAE